MHSIALKTHAFRKLFIVLAFGFLLGFVYIVLAENPLLEPYLLSCVALCGWQCCLYGIARSFFVKPLSIQSKDGFFRKLKKRTVAFFAWILALVFMLCTLAMVYLSYLTMRLA